MKNFKESEKAKDRQRFIKILEGLRANKELNYPAMTLKEIDAYNGALEDIKSILKNFEKF
jgi:hypothetical protein